jgi:hypothetical protein
MPEQPEEEPELPLGLPAVATAQKFQRLPFHSRTTHSYSARQTVRIAVGSGGMGLIFGLVASSFSTAGIVSMTVAAIMLFVAWVVGAVAVTVSEPVWGLPSRHRVVVSLGAIVGLAIMLGGIGWFQSKHLPMTDKGTARVSIDQVTFERIPGQPTYRIDVVLKNIGTATALEYASVVAGKVVTLSNLTPEQIASAQEKLRKLVLTAESTKPASQHFSQLIPTKGHVVWLSDIDATDNSYITLTDAQIADFNSGKLMFYVFLFGHFEDETIAGSAYWEIEACGLYSGTLSYWHNCSPDRLQKLYGSRFP